MHLNLFLFLYSSVLMFFYIDSEEAIEICDNEGELDNDELALIPSRKKVQSSGSIKASLVLLLLFYFSI